MDKFDFFGVDFDEIKRGAREFAENLKGFTAESCCNDYRRGWDGKPGEHERDFRMDELWYPRTNVRVAQDRSLVFEFLLPGFDEKDISLTFKGDKLILRARFPGGESTREECRWQKRSFWIRDIDYREYSVPAERYDQSAVKAVFRNGILTVTIPCLDITESEGAIKIEIVKEGN